MPSFLNNAIAFGFAVALIFLGLNFAQKPEKVYRVFTFGQQPNRLGTKFIRGVSWLYIVGGALGALMFFVMTFLSLFSFH